jgi:hypothetical protein
MSNWIPSPDHIEGFKRAVNALMQNRVNAMEVGFPLDLDQVLLVTTPPSLADLLALGLDSLKETNILCFEIGPDQGASRRCIVKVYLRHEVHYAWKRQTQPRYKADDPIYFNNALDLDTHDKLIKWVDRSVYERRLARLVSLTVADFLRHRPEISLYHIAARWPACKMLFPRVHEQLSGRHRNIWGDHGSQLGKNLRRWEWPLRGEEAEWHDQYRRRMRLCEEAMLSAITLPPVEYKPMSVPVHGEIADWEKRDGQIL